MLLHFLTERSLKDFARTWVSQRNKKFYKIRKTPPQLNKMVIGKITRDGNNLFIAFKVWPTYAKGQEFTLGISDKGQKRNVKYYNMIVEWEDVVIKLEQDNWNDLEFKDKKKIVLDLVDSYPQTKLWSSDPSFLYQGVWKRLDDDGSSVYPFPGFSDSGKWAAMHAHNDQYLNKHSLNLFEIIKFNAGDIVKKVDKVM